MYANDILLYKSINCSEDYRGLQEDIDISLKWLDIKHN